MNWINFLWVWEVVLGVYAVFCLAWVIVIDGHFSKLPTITVLAAIILGSILAGVA